MDVSHLLASHAATIDAVTVDKDTLDVDPAFLTVTDAHGIDPESDGADLEHCLRATARDGIQGLLAALYALPARPSPDGPVVDLPAPKTQLPRAKPLPKPKPPTKWERFAAAKGIRKTPRRTNAVWDDARQAWVARWGKGAKNKQAEAQWIHEVKADAAVDADPVREARDARKARVAKNERQRLHNVARAQQQEAPAAAPARPDRDQRKLDIDRTLASTRISTASMGRFDRRLEGDKKMRGVKRKFDPTEASAGQEKQTSLALISKLDSEAKRARKGGDEVLNVRKAIRAVSKGKGSVALGRETAPKPKGKRGGKRR